MHDEPTYWFPAKRHGWGWGWPTQWQGWAVMVAFGLALLVGAIALLPGYGRAAFVAYAALLCLLLVAVCWIKGEPPGAHWRGK